MTTATTSADETAELIARRWDEIVPVLHDYIAIPNVSEAFDPDWRAHGHMHDAVELIRSWCADRPIAGMSVEVVDPPDLSPLIVIDIPAFGAGDPDDTVLLYGHLDKQPEMVGWREDLGPWIPVREGDKVVMFYGSANRDEDVFPNGDVIDIGRENAHDQLAFGFGIHRCMGSRLAEMQLRVLLEEILERFDKIEVVGEPTRTFSSFVHGYTHLPVQVTRK